MYNVHMKRYNVAEARRRLAAILDAAERGEEVVIERRGVRFAIRLAPVSSWGSDKRVTVEFLDPAVEAGQWTWDWAPGDAGFVSDPKR